MKISEVVSLLEGEVLCGNADLSYELKGACGSDMMSDVLAFVKDHSLLLTGLCNPQVIRTADMMDIKCVVFVRGKRPDEAVVSLAREKGIVAVCSKLRMYSACGILYNNGLDMGETKV